MAQSRPRHGVRASRSGSYFSDDAAILAMSPSFGREPPIPMAPTIFPPETINSPPALTITCGRLSGAGLFAATDAQLEVGRCHMTADLALAGAVSTEASEAPSIRCSSTRLP